MPTEFDRYLDLYRVGDAVQRSVGSMRVGPEDGFLNPPFPVMYSGLNGLVMTRGLGAVGQSLPAPRIEIATPSTGAMIASPIWMQRALNTLLPAAQRVAVDGAVGPQTLEAARRLWQTWGDTAGAAALRALAASHDPRSVSVAPEIAPYASGVRTLKVERAFMYLLAGTSAAGTTPRIQVPDPSGSTCPADDFTDTRRCTRGVTVTPGPVELDPVPPVPPAPASSGGVALLLVAAVAAGAYFWR